MRYPAFLGEHGRIGFCAPSFGCVIEPYRSAFGHAKEVFHGLGHETVDGINVYSSDGCGISSTPERCGKELTDGFLSAECDALISCGGGELMCEILDYVDFDAIREAPARWFMGYSDNTNAIFLLTTLCDTAAIYGPCAPAFGMEPWHESIEDAYALLRGKKLSFEGYAAYQTESLKDEEHPLLPYNLEHPRQLRLWLPGRGWSADEAVTFRGRLVGGCLDCLATLVGTRFDRVKAFSEKYADDGILWFIESCDLNVFGIRRALWQLAEAGWFEHASGFLIGRPLAGQEDLFGLDHLTAVSEILGRFSVPILADVDLGHLPPMIPVISGAVGTVRSQGQAMSLTMELSEGPSAQALSKA